MIILWLIIIVLAAAIMYGFPRQALIIVIIAIIALAGTGFLVHRSDQTRIAGEARRLSLIEVQAKADLALCGDPKFPIHIEITNRSPDLTLLDIRFDLIAYRPNYSNPVVSERFKESDRILAPNETFAKCWPLWSPYSIPGDQTPQSLQWRVVKTSSAWK